ncbi:MAG: chitobiase/beta-hexosaminidase C-terminal domain-containing protein [Phycisphaerae bacterium]
MSKWFYQGMKLVILLSLVLLGGCDLLSLVSQIPLTSDNSSLKWNLTTQTEGEGTVSMDPPGGSYDQNTVVSLSALPADGWQFKSWDTSTENVEVWFQTAWNPSIVIMSCDKTVVAVFEENPSTSQFSLTANTSGYGTVTLNPPGGWYDNATGVQVQALADDGWQFDHWEGDLTGSTNPASITVNDNKTISAVFIQNQIAAAPIFTPDNGTMFVGTQAVQIASATPGATIYYTTDGSDPNESSSRYTETLTLSSTTTVKARAYANLMDPSPISSATYTLTVQDQVATPSISPASQTFYYSLDLYIYCSTEGASIYYTTDGTDPTESSSPYIYSFYIMQTTTIKARAFMAGMIPSDIISETYTATLGY